MVRYRVLIVLLFICAVADAQTRGYYQRLRADTLSVDSVFMANRGLFNGPLTTQGIVPNLGLTYSLGSSSYPYLFAWLAGGRFTNADTVGGAGQTGSKYSYWQNANGYLRLGLLSNGTLSMSHYTNTTGVLRTLMSRTSTGTQTNLSGKWNVDTLNVSSVLTFNSKSMIGFDSTIVILPVLDSSWIATNDTGRHVPAMLMHKWLTVDSMFVAVLGAASTDTVQVDVRWSNDYSTASGGTALQSSPTNCPASTTGTRVGSFTNANIPKFHWLWMRLTKKVGTPKSVSVTLKGRWQ